MRWLERKIEKLFWSILKLPFKLAFQFLYWLLSGERRNSDGYVYRKTSSGKKQLEHRRIAEERLGRRLSRREVVHHINGKRDDNRLSNLCVMGWSEHERYHKWYDWVRKTYGRYPKRETQLRKLKQSFNGELLGDSERKIAEVG